MKTLIVALALVSGAAHAETTAIVNATVHTVSAAGTISSGTVIIEDGRIKAVGAGLAAPAGATVIDAKGAPVTPGFMNSFTRLGLLEIEQYVSTDDTAAADAPFAAAFDVAAGLNPKSVAIPITRAKGVTRAISAPDFGKSMFAGQGAVITLGDDDAFTVKARAAMFVSLGGAAKSRAGGARGAAVITFREALADARYFDRNRADFDDNRARATIVPRLDLEALIPVLQGRQLLAIDAHRASDITNVIALAAEYKLNVVLIGAREAWQVADDLAKAKIPVVLDPTNNLPNQFESLGSTLENAARLQAAGVTVAFMTTGDQLAHNPRDLAQFAGNAVANGMPWDAALAAVTRNPAAIWGIADRYGTLEPGKDADVVVWDGDPLEVTSSPSHVFVLGAATDLTTRQTKLRDRYRDLTRSEPPLGYR
ncbi:MAG: amidohydrolase family protein [Alphaproteobacteria bacterium]|nr:amidohydrolase family protein [Alphaproteobacteria bacterium]